MKRLKNYGLWVAVSALVVDVLIYSHVITIVDSKEIQSFLQRFLEILVLAGILNNPSTGKGFGDK